MKVAAPNGSESTLYCSFCRRSPAEAARLVEGPAVFICESCVLACVQVIGGAQTRLSPPFDDMDDAQLLALLKPSLAAVRNAREMLTALVATLRERGLSWDRIGKAMGVSRQAAWERFG